MSSIFLVIFVITTGFTLLNYTSKLAKETTHQNEEIKSQSPVETEIKTQLKAPKFWFYTELNTRHQFELMEKVLLKLGLEKIEMDTKSIHNDWDFLWSFEYINNIPINYRELNFYQKINHIPGISMITAKDFLSTYTNSKYVPKGFRNKKDLKAYAKKYPSTRFVQKLTTNRGITLKNVTEIEFDESSGTLTNFAQVYVEDPLLIAGHKFDFNIYVVIASVNPLRVYYYSQNTHFRFCPLPYDHNDFSNTGTYIVDDSHIQGTSFPEMQKFFNQSYTLKEGFDAIMREKGYSDTKMIYDQVEDCIRTILIEKEKYFIQEIAKFDASYGKMHFFELVRFDFLIDASLNLHLMEVNLSPNLHAVDKNIQSKPLFESVIYNYMNLVGVGTYLSKNHIGKFEDDEEEFLCHDSSISVNPEACMGSQCKESCGSEICMLCLHCMTNTLKYDLKMAYLEQMNAGEMKRIVPPENVGKVTF